MQTPNGKLAIVSGAGASMGRVVPLDPARRRAQALATASHESSLKMERRLAAIFAADVVGYSRLMELDETGTFERLRAHRQELFEPTIIEHHGRVFKLMGDGLLAEHVDPDTREAWGNFPQTYSMVGLINSAMRLSIPWSRAF